MSLVLKALITANRRLFVYSVSDSKNDANLRDQYKGMIFDDQWFGVSLSASQSGFFTVGHNN